LFQILTHRFSIHWECIRVLDLFAGTGALGIEALSRGAQKAIFIDQSASALSLIRKNLSACAFLSRAELIKAKVGPGSRTFIKGIKGKGPFDLILADPPYEKSLSKLCLETVCVLGLLSKSGVMVIEESKSADLPKRMDRRACNNMALVLEDHRVYGQTALWFYKIEE